MIALRAVAIVAVLSAAALFTATPSIANKVGVAAAVNPDAFSGGKQIRIGKSIFFNERISTDANGVVQVLLVDGSTFTIGKNSNVVIDRFVYDPNKDTGEIVASFSKGSMRFIGGKISKNTGGVTVKTPDGTLAIRGGMFQGAITGSGAIYAFLFGNEMIFRGNNGKVFTLFQPGYVLQINGDEPIIRPTTPEDIQLIMAGLSNSNTNTAGITTETLPPQPNYVILPKDFDQLIIDATQTRINGEILEQLLALLELSGPTPFEPIVIVDESIEASIGGFGSGLVLSSFPEEPGFGASTSPSDLAFDAQTDVITLTLRDVEDDGGTINRGVFTFTPISNNQWDLSNLQLIDQSGGVIPVESATGQLERQTQALCSGCSFMDFGTFGASWSYSGGEESTINEDIELGWWVAGPVTAGKDLPRMGTARYDGQAFGSIAAIQLEGQVAGRGDLGMTWDFAKRSGEFSITNFNASSQFGLPDLNARGTMTMPGNLNRFSGNLGGTLGDNLQNQVSGRAIGSFVTDGSRPAAGVIGNWGVANPNGYRATGIFGGVARR